jgi:hypothetical protein
MSYDWERYKHSSGARSWCDCYIKLGPTCWYPESISGRIIKILIFLPWLVVWIIGLIPSGIVLSLIGGSYNYIKYDDFVL